MDASFVPPPLDPDESVIELGNAADLTLGEGKADKEDKRKIYNWRADQPAIWGCPSRRAPFHMIGDLLVRRNVAAEPATPIRDKPPS